MAEKAAAQSSGVWPTLNISVKMLRVKKGYGGQPRRV
jgi:hypothetical protein